MKRLHCVYGISMVGILRIVMSRIYVAMLTFWGQYQSQHFPAWYFKTVGWSEVSEDGQTTQ